MTKKFKIFFNKFLVHVLIFSHVIQTTQTFAQRIEDLEPEINLAKTRFSNKYISHKVNLDKNVEENFSINFSSFLSEPCRLDYFNQDSLIAQAFINNDYVIFQGGEKHNFVIDSPLKVNKFFCKTRGNLTFLKDVSALSACVQANSLFIHDQFSIEGKAKISSFTDIFSKGKISASFLNLKAKGKIQLLGDTDTQRTILTTGDILNIGNQEKSNALKAIHSLLIKAKRINNFGFLSTDSGRLTLNADEIYNAPKASILSGEKSSSYPGVLINNDEIRLAENLGRLVIQSHKFQNALGASLKSGQDLFLRIKELKNEGTIEGVTGGFLKNQIFQNSGTFHIHGQFDLNTDNFFENKGHIIFDQTAFVKANKFSNLKQWQSFGSVNISATELLYNSGKLHFSQPVSLQALNIMNGGQIEASHALKLQGDKMKNYGRVNIQGASDFSLTGDFFNDPKGEIYPQKLTQITYQNFYNKGKWDGEENIISQGTNFVNDSGAKWYTKGIWQHKSDKLTLGGDVNAGALALFDIGELARFSGKLHATAMQVSSQSSIISDPAADFDITHHLGLSAWNAIDFDSRILDRSSTSKERLSTTFEQQKLIESLPKGVFLSAGKTLKKAGEIVAEQGTVSMSSQGRLTHVGFSESGLNIHDRIVLKASDLLKIEDELKSYGVLDLSSEKKMILEKSAHLKAKDVQLKAKDSMENQGHIDVQNSLSSRSSYFYNTGYISSKNLHFKADRLFSNSIDYRSFFPKLLAGDFSNLFSGGTIKGEQTTIDALVSANPLGHISSKSLTTHSGLDFNMGRRSAYNMNLNSLASLNMGLDLPRIDSWGDVFNVQNLKTAGKTLFTTFAPSEVRLACNVGMSLYRLPQMYRQGHQLYQSAVTIGQQEDVGFSDIIPLLCGIKDLATSSIQLGYSLKNNYESGYNLWNTVTDESFSFKDYVPSLDDVRDSVSSSIQDLSWWQSTAGTIAGSIGPQFTKDSLININLGASLGVNTYERSLYSLNSGINVAANTYTNDTLFGQNRGILVASNLNISAQGDYESTGTLLGVSGSLKGHNLFIGGYTGFYEKFQAEAKNHLNITRESSINTETAILHAKTVENAGKVHGSKKATIKAEETLHQAKGAELKGQNVHAQAKNIKNEGAIRGKEDTHVIAQHTVTNSSGGSIEGKSTYVAGKSISNAGKVHGSKEATIKAEETLHQAKGAELKGQNVHAQAKNIKNEGAIRGKEDALVIAQNKVTNSAEGSIEGKSAYVAGKNISNAGKVHGSKEATIKAEETLHQAKGAELKGQNVYAQAKNIKNEGAIRGKEDTHVIAQHTVTNSSGGSIEGKSTYVAGKNISNAGKVHGSKEATIKAENTLHNQKGAQLTGRNVLMEAENIKQDGLSKASERLITKGQQVTVSGTSASEGLNLVLRKDETKAGSFTLAENGKMEGHHQNVDMGKEGKVDLQEGSLLKTLPKGEEAGFTSITTGHLKQKGDIDTSGILAIDTNTGEFLAHKLKGDALNLKLQHHNEGTRGALKMVDSFDKMSQVALDMSHQDFKNTEDLKLKHAHLSGSFKSIDNGKTIHADGFLSLEGKESIVNRHAHIHAEEGLHLKSDGDITLSAREFTEQGPHDSYQAYDPSKLTTNGDLFVEAGGKLEAPMLQASAGSDAILSGVKGVNLDSRSSVYRSEEWDNSNLWGEDRGYKEDVKLFQTDVQAKGHLVIKSSEGAIEARGANLSAKNGNIIADGHKGVNVNPLTTTVNSHHYTSSWFGLSNSETNESHTEVRNFEGTAKDKIQLTSADGKIEMRSAQMRADKIALKGTKGIDARAIEREDKIKTTEKGLTLNMFGVDLANPKGTPKFTGPSLGVRAGYSENTVIQTNQEGVQGTLSANHISVETGKGADTNLHGMNIQGLEKGSKVKSFESDTDHLLLGGTKKNQSNETQSWNVTVGADVTGDISLGGGYKQQSYQTDTYDQADVNIDQFVNHRTGAKVQIGEGIKADINQTTGEKFDLDVDHAQTKQSQSGWSAGGELSINPVSGIPGGGLYGGYNTGEKRSSERLTQVNIGNGTNFTRTDIHHEDYDTRAGFEANGSVNSKGMQSMGLSVQKGDNNFQLQYHSLTKGNSSSKIVNTAHKAFNATRVADMVHKNGVKNVTNIVKNQGWVSKETGEKLDEINGRIDEGLHHAMSAAGVASQLSGMAASKYYRSSGQGGGSWEFNNKSVTKAVNAIEHADIHTGKLLSRATGKNCVQQTFKEAGLPFQESLQATNTRPGLKGIKSKDLEKNLNHNNLQTQPATSEAIKALPTGKATVVIENSRTNKGHMATLYKNKDGSLNLHDSKGEVTLDTHDKVHLVVKKTRATGSLDPTTYVGGKKRKTDVGESQDSENRLNLPVSEKPIEVTHEDIINSGRYVQRKRTDSLSSITTVSTASSDLEYSGNEWAGPTPHTVQRNTQKRIPKHQQEFNKNTGFDSATKYAQNQKESFNKPQIGHAHGYQNHGPDADTRENNLFVIEQAGNLQMNKADGYYRDGQIDGNVFSVKKGTRTAECANQNLRNPNHPELLVTPSIITDTRKASFSPEASEKQKKRIERAFDPTRIQQMQDAQNKSPSSFPNDQETFKKVNNRIAKDKRNGTCTGLETYKFSEQSRSKRLPYHDLSLEELYKLASKPNTSEDSDLIQKAIKYKSEKESK